MPTISITDLRNSLKDILYKVKAGQVIQITQRGKVIATINPAVDHDDELAFNDRLAAYRSGIVIQDDIVNKPMKQYDFNDDSLFTTDIAAEPDE